MNTNKLLVTLASVVFAVAGSTALVACSSDDSSNPAPAPLDASTADTSTTADSGTMTDSGGHADTGTTTDSGAADTGPCTSDAATCNSCVTAATDPLHACAPATANCIPFDNTRVPANVPQP